MWSLLLLLSQLLLHQIPAPPIQSFPFGLIKQSCFSSLTMQSVSSSQGLTGFSSMGCCPSSWRLMADSYATIHPRILWENVASVSASNSFVSLLTAPSSPGFIKFSELTTTSVNVSWDPPLFPNGILEGYRLIYEPCMPVDGEELWGTLFLWTGDADNANQAQWPVYLMCMSVAGLGGGTLNQDPLIYSSYFLIPDV